MKKDTFILLSLLFFQCYYCSAFVASVHIAFSLCSTLDIKPFFHFYHISQSVSSLTLSPSHPKFAMLSVLSVLSILYRLSLSYSLTLALSHSVSLSVSLSQHSPIFTLISFYSFLICVPQRERMIIKSASIEHKYNINISFINKSCATTQRTCRGFDSNN